jgi:hypothetical protein
LRKPGASGGKRSSRSLTGDIARSRPTALRTVGTSGRELGRRDRVGQTLTSLLRRWFPVDWLDAGDVQQIAVDQVPGKRFARFGQSDDDLALHYQNHFRLAHFVRRAVTETYAEWLKRLMEKVLLNRFRRHGVASCQQDYQHRYPLLQCTAKMGGIQARPTCGTIRMPRYNCGKFCRLLTEP